MKTQAPSLSPARTPAGARPSSLLARGVLARLGGIESDTLTLSENGRRHVLGRPELGAPQAELEVHDERFWSAVALRGGIGAGEAYAKGWWSSESATEAGRTRS